MLKICLNTYEYCFIDCWWLDPGDGGRTPPDVRLFGRWHYFSARGGVFRWRAVVIDAGAVCPRHGVCRRSCGRRLPRLAGRCFNTITDRFAVGVSPLVVLGKTSLDGGRRRRVLLCLCRRLHRVPDVVSGGEVVA